MRSIWGDRNVLFGKPKLGGYWAQLSIRVGIDLEFDRFTGENMAASPEEERCLSLNSSGSITHPSKGKARKKTFRSCKLHTDKTQQSERLCYLTPEWPCSFCWGAASSSWLNRGCCAELPPLHCCLLFQQSCFELLIVYHWTQAFLFLQATPSQHDTLRVPWVKSGQ